MPNPLFIKNYDKANRTYGREKHLFSARRSNVGGNDEISRPARLTPAARYAK